ncbi:MAG: hypothetical protein OXB92_17225, partial [Acidimicrobiaceae bacterium]|nr:hypothetical protein [Acidimicrobiaceae bacterium]
MALIFMVGNTLGLADSSDPQTKATEAPPQVTSLTIKNANGIFNQGQGRVLAEEIQGKYQTFSLGLPLSVGHQFTVELQKEQNQFQLRYQDMNLNWHFGSDHSIKSLQYLSLREFNIDLKKGKTLRLETEKIKIKMKDESQQFDGLSLHCSSTTSNRPLGNTIAGLCIKK